MGDRSEPPPTPPGERVEVPLDRAGLYLPLYVLAGAWLLLLLLAWNDVASWIRGETRELGGPVVAWLVGVSAGGVLLGALALRGIRRTARTVFTTEGVWQPGWLGGGRFLRWAEVERAELLRGAHGGIARLRLRSRDGRMVIRLNAFRRPSQISRLVKRYVGERADEEGPLEDPE